MARRVIALHRDHKKREPVVEKSSCIRQILIAAKQGVHWCKSDIPESRRAGHLYFYSVTITRIITGNYCLMANRMEG